MIVDSKGSLDLPWRSELDSLLEFELDSLLEWESELEFVVEMLLVLDVDSLSALGLELDQNLDSPSLNLVELCNRAHKELSYHNKKIEARI